MDPIATNEFSRDLPGGSAMPPEKPGPLSKQTLRELPDGLPRKAASENGMRSSSLRRFVVLAISFLLSAYAVYEMYMVFHINALTVLEWIILFLFAITFSWISLGFSNSLAGFFTLFKKRSKREDVDLEGRVAIVMPIYNESEDRVFSRIEAMALKLGITNQGHAFDWFILSDSTDPRHILAEEQAFWILRQATAGKVNVYYRRRLKNQEHKAGNIEDFCRRWGGGYDSFIVIDADSIMETGTFIQLAARMQSDPDAGLIQTIPMLINGKTPFALVQQFATRMYAPLLGRGTAWWTQNEGIYWGHNAILRTEAYRKAAALPVLEGSPPFGGPILSHDIVEGALIRRAGWSVIIADDLDGSYEESPPSLYDLSVRDRRWCQGNLQHSKIISACGLHWVSRFQLILGIFSYLASLLWFMLIISGLLLSLQSHYFRPEYFTEKFTLFPIWPKIDYERALTLFIFTMGVLFAPKILGLAKVLFSKNCKSWGGRLRLLFSFITEIILSALLAPIMMLLQTANVLSILLFKKDCQWMPQRRGDGGLSYPELYHFHRWHMWWGILLGYASSIYSWELLAWMSPALIGLWFSIPLSAMTASQKVGKWFRKEKLLSTPEEINRPDIVLDIERRQKEYVSRMKKSWDVRLLLQQPDLMALHLGIIDRQPIHLRGTPIDSLDAAVILKVNEGESREGVLHILSNAELSYLLGQDKLLQRLAGLPKS